MSHQSSPQHWAFPALGTAPAAAPAAERARALRPSPRLPPQRCPSWQASIGMRWRRGWGVALSPAATGSSACQHACVCATQTEPQRRAKRMGGWHSRWLCAFPAHQPAVRVLSQVAPAHGLHAHAHGHALSSHRLSHTRVRLHAPARLFCPLSCDRVCLRRGAAQAAWAHGGRRWTCRRWPRSRATRWRSASSPRRRPARSCRCGPGPEGWAGGGRGAGVVAF